MREIKTKITDGDLELRKLSDEKINFDELALMANNYEIAKYVGHGFPHPYGTEEAKKFHDYAKDAWESGKEYVYGIFLNDQYVGNIGFKIDEDNNIIKNIGYWLSKEHEGKGVMTRAVKLISDYCLNELNLRKIEAHVYEGNIGSMTVLTRNGYELEGIKKKSHQMRDGTTLDSHIFGKLK